MAYGTVTISAFHKGMVSAVTQDLFFNKTNDGSNVQLEGYVWLDNFDPNVLLGSIVKRKGFVRPYLSQADLETVLLSSVMFETDTPMFQSNNRVFKGMGYLRAKKHHPADNHFLLYTYLKEGVHVSSGSFWYNPSDEKPLSPNRFNQWFDIDWDKDANHNKVFAYGDLRDFEATSNIVLIATEKDARMFKGTNFPIRPVYVFFFDTNDEDIEHVLEPYDNFTNINPHRWRLRTTTEDINSVTKIEMLPVPKLTEDINSMPVPKGLYPPKTLGLHGYQGTQALDYLFDDGLPIDRLTSRNDEELADLQNTVSVVWWESSNAPKHKEDFVYSVGNYFGSVERTNLLDDSALAPYEPNQFMTQARSQARIWMTRNGVEEPWIDAALDGIQGRLDPSDRDKYKDYMAPEPFFGNPFTLYSKAFSKKADLIYSNNLQPSVDVYVATQNYDVNDESRATAATYKQTLQEYFPGGKEFGSLSFEEYSDDFAANHSHLYETMYKDYASNNMPRPWFKSEKIPYVVTAIVNGAELEVTRDVYIVKNSNVPQSNLHHYGAIVVGRGGPSSDNSNFATASYPPGSLYPVKPPFRGRALDGAKWHFETGSNEYTFRHNDTNTLAAAKDRADLKQKIPVKTAKYYLNHDSCYVYFTLKLNIDPTKLPQGLTEIRVYISEPNQVQGVVRRTSEGLDFSPSTLGYGLPLVQSDEDNQYRLAKRFIIKGGESDREFDGKWTYFNKAQYGVSGYNATNSWVKYSIPQSGAVAGHPPHPWIDTDPTDNKDFYFAVPEGSGWEDVPSNLMYSLNFSNNDGSKPAWTPDFCVWDYPAFSPALSSNLKAIGEQLWEGKGAKHICVHKGLTVIAGCQDKDFNEEVGVIRISMIQAGVPIPDIFREVDKVYASQKPTTALISFRDQIMVFAEDEFSRVASDDVSEIASYRVIERVDGQGVSSKKHVVNTPLGVVFMNKAGVWITNGTELQELSEVIAPTYRALVTSEDREATPALLNEIVRSKCSGLDFEHAELAYDSLENELHVFLPHRFLTQDDFGKESSLFPPFASGRKEHIILVYNFKAQNWRVVTIPAATEGSNQKLIAHTFGECRFLMPTSKGVFYPTFSLDKDFYNFVLSQQGMYPGKGINQNAYLIHLDINYFEGGRGTDGYARVRDFGGNNLPEDLKRFMEAVYTAYGSYSRYSPKIVPLFLTTDIGNGYDDYSLKRFGIEGSPYSIEAQSVSGNFNGVTSQYNGDPVVKLYTRVSTNERLWNKSSFHEAYYSPVIDIFGKQMRNAWRQWFVRTSPNRGNRLNFSTRESFKFLVPFGIQFRRSQLLYQGDALGNIRNITLEYTFFSRRVYS